MAGSPERARLFVGLSVPAPLHAPLLACRQVITEPWRWPPPERLHITLAFIGDVARDAVSEIATALAPLTGHDPLPAQVAELIGFPRRQAATILARAVTLTDALQALRTDTVAALRPWLKPEETNRFVPHITLGRSKSRLVVPELALPPLDWMAIDVLLIESRLLAHGPEYQTVASVALGAKPWSRGGSNSH